MGRESSVKKERRRCGERGEVFRRSEVKEIERIRGRMNLINFPSSIT